MRDQYIRAICELAEQDESIVLLTGDVGFGVLTGFWERFPAQFFNAGVSEQNMTAMAAGLALEGRKVFTYSIGNFPTLRCLEQLRNDVCYHDLNVTVLAVGGGFSYGQLGMSHFATEDLAILRALPNMRVVAPADPWEAYELAKQLYANPGPTYVRLDKSAAGLPVDPASVTLGEVRTIRHGTDISIVAVGGIVAEALLAAEQLSRDGIDVRVLAVNSLRPLNPEPLIVAASETKGVVTLEEHTVMGGLGSAVSELILEAGVAPGFFRRLGIPDEYPSIVGDQAFLRNYYGLNSEGVVRAIHALQQRTSEGGGK